MQTENGKTGVGVGGNSCECCVELICVKGICELLVQPMPGAELEEMCGLELEYCLNTGGPMNSEIQS